MSKFYNLLGVSAPFDPDHTYTTSWLLPPFLLGLVRSLLSLYAFVTIFFIWGWDDSHHTAYLVRQWFSYFTNLTYVGLAFYFLFSAIHTFSYARTGTALLQRWPRSLQAAHAVFYSTVVTYPFLVTIVYWGVLYKNPWFPIEEQAWSNVSQHAINSLYALFEVLLARTAPRPPFHLLLLIIILALYLGLAYITRATEGFYVYHFLDPSTGAGHVAGYCIGIFVAQCVIFGIVWVVMWLRHKATRNLGRFAHDRRPKSNTSPEEGYVETVEMRAEAK